MQIRCKPGSLEDKDNKAESGLSSKITQKHSKLGSLEDQGPKSKISKINFASWIRGFWRHLSHPFFLKDQDPKTESRFSPKIMQISRKPAGLEDQDSKTESRFSPKIMQIHCKQGGLEDKDPKTEFGVSPKIMQKHSKPGSLEGQGPKSKISKINFTSWIRGFCRHLYTVVSSFFLKDQDPKTESRFSPKIMQIRCKATGLEDQDPKTESRFSPKIMQINCKQGGLEMFGG